MAFSETSKNFIVQYNKAEPHLTGQATAQVKVPALPISVSLVKRTSVREMVLGVHLQGTVKRTREYAHQVLYLALDGRESE